MFTPKNTPPRTGNIYLRTETHPEGMDFVNRKLSEKAHFLETEAIQ